jgi:hypothetical protein
MAMSPFSSTAAANSGDGGSGKTLNRIIATSRTKKYHETKDSSGCNNEGVMRILAKATEKATTAASDGCWNGSSAIRYAEQKEDLPNQTVQAGIEIGDLSVASPVQITCTAPSKTESNPVKLGAASFGSLSEPNLFDSSVPPRASSSVQCISKSTPELECDTLAAEETGAVESTELLASCQSSCRRPRRLRRSCSEKLIAAPSCCDNVASEKEFVNPSSWLTERIEMEKTPKQLQQQKQLRQLQLRRCDSEKLPTTAAAAASFSSPLYRGFLLRHTSRRQRDLPGGGSTAAAGSSGAAGWLLAARLAAEASTSPASHKHVLTPREVKNRSERRRTMVTSIHTIF